MSGRTDTAPGTGGRLAGLGRPYRRYVAVDGGRGAHLLAELADLDPHLQPAPSPRHAQLLLVVEPISSQLAPAVAEVARALPRPARALILAEPNHGLPGVNVVPAEEILPGARRVEATSARDVLAATMDRADWPELAVADIPPPDEKEIPVPDPRKLELATEPAVLSLGPIQPFTAGPLRLLLIADGGQLLSARVEAGYAHRGVAEAMVHADWGQAGQIARHLDPLAPLAGLVAYVRALEGLQGRPSPERVEPVREAALALERSQNHLWWLTRFLDVLGSDRLVPTARRLATALAGESAMLWEQPPTEWIVPQGGAAPFRASAVAELRRLTPEVAGLRDRVLGDRLLGLRTRGIDVLAAERMQAAGVTGPALQASEHGAGDIAARLAARMEEAMDGLSAVADLAGRPAEGGESLPQWTAPPGSAQVVVEGPRGQIALGLVSDGGDGPAAVSWRRPSMALLALVPELLAGQKLGDAEASVVSLDLAMAEADG